MPRIFLSLVVANLLLLLGAATLGLSSGESGVDRHIVLAVFTLLLSCFIQVLVFTYFTVTGKVVGQAVHLSDLPPGPLDKVRGFKRAITYRVATMFGSILAVVATGAAAWRSDSPVVSHPVVAGVVVMVHLWIWLQEYRLIVSHARFVEETLSRYEAKGRGSAVEA